MLHSRIHQCLIIVLTLLLTFSLSAGHAAACKVLVMTSFTEDFFWSQDITRGVEKVLDNQCELKYVYLETEVNPDGVEAKAREAYSLYQEFQPDGVIAEGDDAQVHFVIPYLKDKVDTPVMFAEIYGMEAYGYPASNVSGVPANPFFKESLTFARQLVPSIQTVGFVFNDNNITRAGVPVVQDIFKEQGINVLEPVFSNNIEEILAKTEQIKSDCDAIFLPVSLGEKAIRKLLKVFKKPTFTAWGEAIRYGVLCTVTENGEEIGRLAAEMLQKAMNGIPVSEIPISTVEYGTRMVNVNTMKALGIKPSRRVLTGVELIK